PASGPIRASNPCSEYMFLDDTACNLASLNLLAFRGQRADDRGRTTDDKALSGEKAEADETRVPASVLRPPSSVVRFDLDGLEHAVRLWTIVLEISVLMAQFPSREIAELSYEYRTLGLGYANVGGLLMSSGIPYDSDAGRAVCGALTAIVT